MIFSRFGTRLTLIDKNTDASGNVSGPKTSLPAHELGHTFGLSVDPTIKKWPCSLAGDLGVIACGMVGGFDEYNSNTHPDGVPTWGYWVPQGPIPPSMLSITGEQCNTSCMMGSTAINAHDSWLLAGRWVDAADYEQLITRLQRGCGGGFQPSWRARRWDVGSCPRAGASRRSSAPAASRPSLPAPWPRSPPG